MSREGGSENGATTNFMTVLTTFEWKDWLLKYKAVSNPDSADIEKLFQCFEEVMLILADNGITDKQRVQSIEVMGMLILKMFQIIKKDAKVSDFEVRVKKELMTVGRATFLFHYVIDFWTDNTVSMEIPLKNMFEKLLQLLNLLYEDIMRSILNTWVEMVLSLEESMKVQYYLIEIFANQLDVHFILRLKPNFVEMCFDLLKTESLCTTVGKCLSTVLLNWYRYHFDQESMQEWLELWKPMCCKYLKDSRYTKNIQLYILSNVFGQLPGSFEIFIMKHEEFPLPLLLSLLKIGQELAIEEEPFHEEKFIGIKDLISLLQHEDSKLAAFELLTYSNKRSKQIQPYVYDILKDNIEIFFVDYNLQTRNYFHSSFKLFIKRVRDSSYSLNRDALKLQKKNKFPEEQLSKRKKVAQAHSFMIWLFQYLKEQMAPGSQYQRKSLAYQILKTMVFSGIDFSVPEKFLDSKQRTQYPFEIKVFDKALLRILIDDLTNNYDDIRDNAFDLLTIAFQSSENKSLLSHVGDMWLFSTAMEMLLSYKLSDGGAKICELLFTVAGNKMEYLKTLIKRLKQLINDASVDLIGNISQPVSGMFTALALVVNRFDFSKANTELLQNILDLIFKNWETVNEIVCHDSPEGNLPQQYLDCDVSDQVITSYAFRSIKESSLLMKNLLSTVPLSKSQIIQCGNLLLSQLSTIRHSGAFQSVFPTYIKLCSRSNRDCPEQLNVWLRLSLKSLQTKSQYITRRSGGLPFMISAILAAETDCDRKWLNETFDKLFEIATIPVLEHEEKLDLPQVHAFNCIRAIFTESKLSHYSSPYVSDALELCLQKFTSPVWSMRNCSIMLFTALQNRLFGKLGKSTSARLFFTRFKGIREALLDNLRNAILSTSFSAEQVPNADSLHPLVASQSKTESIFLVFTILSRLKPTLGYDGLDEFKSEIIKALGCSSWKIREIAARTLVPLVDDPVTQLSLLVSEMLIDNFSQDKLHGYLLAVKELLTSDYINDKIYAEKNCVGLILSGYRKFLWTNRCFVTSKTYVEILEVLLKFGILDYQEESFIVDILGNCFINLNKSYTLDGSKQLLLAVIVRILLHYGTKDSHSDIALLALESDYFEVQLSALECLLQKDLNATQFDDIFIRLSEMLSDTSIWAPVKAEALKVLQKGGYKISNANFDLLLTDESESLQSSLLENLSVFESVPPVILWMLVNKYSKDECPVHLRLASAKCLVNSFPKFKTFDIVFKLYLMLFDDDLEVRRASSQFLEETILNSSSFEINLSAFVTSKRFINRISEIFPPDDIIPLVIQTLGGLRPGFDVTKTTSMTENDLFAVEKDNQFRNDIQLGFQCIHLLKVLDSKFTGIGAALQQNSYLRDLASLGNSDKDGFLKWGSKPEVFNSLVLARKTIAIFDDNLDSFDNQLKEMNCHPLILEYRV